MKKYSKWMTWHTCSKCNHELTRREIMYSYGTCPYCGYTVNSTVLDYKKSSYRYVYEVERRSGLLGLLGFNKTTLIKEEVKLENKN